MLIGAGYVVFILIGSFFGLADAGLGAIVYGSAIILYVIQIIFYIVLGWLLLQYIYRWSRLAIILSTIACPLALLIIVSSISNQFGYTVDLSHPIGIGILIFFALTPLAMGVVAYNDIRYRLPNIYNKS